MIPVIPNAETILLVADYIRHRLQLHDYEWEDCCAPVEPDEVRTVMRRMCDKMEQHHGVEIGKFNSLLIVSKLFIFRRCSALVGDHL